MLSSPLETRLRESPIIKAVVTWSFIIRSYLTISSFLRFYSLVKFEVGQSTKEPISYKLSMRLVVHVCSSWNTILLHWSLCLSRQRSVAQYITFNPSPYNDYDTIISLHRHSNKSDQSIRWSTAKIIMYLETVNCCRVHVTLYIRTIVPYYSRTSTRVEKKMGNTRTHLGNDRMGMMEGESYLNSKLDGDY